MNGDFISIYRHKYTFWKIFFIELPVTFVHEVARITKKDYVCLRKKAKCYMLNPVSTNGESITSGKSTYFISEPELSLLKNKNVFL